MDSDFSHPPDMIPKMLDKIEETQCDVVIASRYVEGGDIQGWSTKRKLISKAATEIAKKGLESARLYLKLEEYESARIYLQDVLTNYYDSNIVDDNNDPYLFLAGDYSSMIYLKDNEIPLEMEFNITVGNMNEILIYLPDKPQLETPERPKGNISIKGNTSTKGNISTS